MHRRAEIRELTRTYGGIDGLAGVLQLGRAGSRDESTTMDDSEEALAALRVDVTAAERGAAAAARH